MEQDKQDTPQSPIPDDRYIRLFQIRRIDQTSSTEFMGGTKNMFRLARSQTGQVEIWVIYKNMLSLSTQNGQQRLMIAYDKESNTLLSLSIFALSLATHLRHEAPPYYALSYRWGEELETGIPGVKVSQSFLECLPSLYRIHAGWWWVDGICIDQENVKEKAGQLQIMGEIYSGASRVVAYIGQHDDSSRLAVEFYKTVFASLAPGGKLYNNGLQYRFNGPVDITLQRAGLPDITDRSWTALYRLCTRPYFSRMWMVQEIALSKSVWALCGDTSYFGLGPLQSVFLWLVNTGLSNQIHANIPTQERYRLRARLMPAAQRVQHCQSKNVVTQLSFTISLDATDPKDKIMGVLGLLDKSDPMKAIVASLYQEISEPSKFNTAVTAAIISNTQDLRILESVDSTSRGDGSLPSWVPLYRFENEHGVGGVPPTKFEAGRNSKFTVNISDDYRKCNLEAMVVDEVLHVADGEPFRESDTHNAMYSWLTLASNSIGITSHYWWLALEAAEFFSIEEICQHFFKIEEDVQCTRVFTVTPQDLPPLQEIHIMCRQLDNFWRTTLQDTVDQQCPAPSEFKSHFFDYFFNVLTAADTREKLPDQTGRLVPRRKVRLSANYELEERESQALESEKNGDLYRQKFAEVSLNRRFFVTKAGRFGLGPLGIRPKHLLCITGGSEQLLTLEGVGLSHKLIGTSYVHGLMSGEGSFLDDAIHIKTDLI